MADLVVDSINLYRYKVEMHAPLPYREGLIMQLNLRSGLSFFAEASPLPSRSKETLSDVIDQLMRLKSCFIGMDVETLFSSVLSDDTLFPALSFALFSALYQIKREKRKLCYPLSALLMGNYDTIKHQIESGYLKSFTHVKLKTSELSTYQARDITSHLIGKYRLRLDLNRNWSKEQTLAFFNHYSSDTFEYIEEPSSKEIDHPIALDESLIELKSTLNLANIKAIVIKPTVLGIGPGLRKMIDESKSQGMIVSLSSSFETGLGLYQIALFAEYVKSEAFPLGLDTYRFLKQDVLSQKHLIQNAAMHFSEPSLDMAQLIEKKICSIC